MWISALTLMTLVTCTSGNGQAACTTRHLGPFLTFEQCVDEIHSIGNVIHDAADGPVRIHAECNTYDVDGKHS